MCVGGRGGGGEEEDLIKLIPDHSLSIYFEIFTDSFDRLASSGTYGDSFHKYVFIWDENHIR